MHGQAIFRLGDVGHFAIWWFSRGHSLDMALNFCIPRSQIPRIVHFPPHICWKSAKSFCRKTSYVTFRCHLVTIIADPAASNSLQDHITSFQNGFQRRWSEWTEGTVWSVRYDRRGWVGLFIDGFHFTAPTLCRNAESPVLTPIRVWQTSCECCIVGYGAGFLKIGIDDGATLYRNCVQALRVFHGFFGLHIVYYYPCDSRRLVLFPHHLSNIFLLSLNPQAASLPVKSASLFDLWISAQARLN